MHAKRSTVALVVLPVAAYVLLLFLVAALYVQPPLVGWIGFGIVAAVGIAVAVGAVVLFPRMRANVGAADAERASERLLVLADTRCPSSALCDRLAAHVGGREVEVRVVAPVLPSRLHYVSDDERAEHAEANARVADAVSQLRHAGIEATGQIGTDDPLQALGDALATFHAAELVIVTPQESHWLEDALVEHARELVPSVEQLVVAREVVAA